jgi:hypothetical protein
LFCDLLAELNVFLDFVIQVAHATPCMTQPEVPNTIGARCAVSEVRVSETAEGVVTSLIRSSEWIDVVHLLLITIAGSANAQNKPNVVVILSDNVGYGDIGAYGAGEIRGMPTPRLDQLASESE